MLFVYMFLIAIVAGFVAGILRHFWLAFLCLGVFTGFSVLGLTILRTLVMFVSGKHH